MGRFWKKHKEKLWAPFEALMLLSALLAPVFFSDHSSLKTAVFRGLQISGTFMEFDLSNPQRNIASTIVSLEPPGVQQVSSTIVTDRQIRFEAFVKPSQEWEVQELRRVGGIGGDVEVVPLIFDKSRSSRVSTFIELEPGHNRFLVQYKSKDGRVMESPLVVDHSRKDNPD